ncbi:hypothetical protein CVV38_02710 [Candidatus Peregrinibacteria bacterium HGW-Peregrinibacteria-1]|jgi:hypothetical protein|nr:MAG: hypothetical protein CVV38_02710 [Candidatus Peregrinibacteria bacterium HGW-Peregrinibacteria-1]
MSQSNIKLTPQEFTELLHQTSLDAEQKQMVIDLLPLLTPDQINQVAEELRKNAREFDRILTNMESEQNKAILDHEIKQKQNNQ